LLIFFVYYFIILISVKKSILFAFVGIGVCGVNVYNWLMFILYYEHMKKLMVPFLILVVVVQFVLLWLAGKDGDLYPRVSRENDRYIVEILDNAMEDDAVRAVKYRLELTSDEFGQWNVADQSSTWACWPGRGNQDFGDEWCE
jgi:hypothetical protein